MTLNFKNKALGAGLMGIFIVPIVAYFLKIYLTIIQTSKEKGFSDLPHFIPITFKFDFTFLIECMLFIGLFYAGYLIVKGKENGRKLGIILMTIIAVLKTVNFFFSGQELELNALLIEVGVIIVLVIVIYLLLRHKTV
jgi:tryptophan-rich sensory protein